MAESRLEIAIDSRGAEANARGVRRELEGMERAGITATRAARSTAGGFGRIARQSQLAVPPVSNLTSLLGGLSAALVTREVIGYSDAWQNAGNQLRQVTDSAEELAGTQERLMAVANSTRSDFASTAGLYSRLARSTTELGLSQQDLIGLTRTINQSFAVSGATADEAAAAITQLSQGLAAGALRGDEFNSVSEQAPGIMRAIAESLDMTIGDLRDFAAEGGITADIVVTALQDSADAIENDFGKAVATFGQQMTVARNNMLQFVGSSDTVEGAVGNIGEAVVGLSENLDELGQAATVVAGLLAGRLAGRFVTLAAGMTSAAGAAGLLRGALAFLGGPVGILVGAGGLLYAFREELGLIPEPAKAAREEIELLTGSLDSLNNSSIDAAMIAINAQMFELEKRSRAVREELENLENSGSGALGMSPGATGQQARLLAEQGQIGADQGALSEQMEKLRALGQGLDDTSESASQTASTLMQTNEEAGRLTNTAIQAAVRVAEHGESSTKATRAIDTFAAASESAASRIAAIGRTPDPRYGGQGRATQDTESLSSRARERFEASAYRGERGVTWYGSASSGDSAIPTASSMSRSAPSAPAGGKNLGTVTLAKEGGGKIDVQANEAELSNFVTQLLSGAASAV